MSLTVNLPIIIRYIVLDHLQKLLFIPVPNYQAFEVEPTFKVMYPKYFLKYDYVQFSHFYVNQLLSADATIYNNTFIFLLVLPTKI